MHILKGPLPRGLDVQGAVWHHNTRYDDNSMHALTDGRHTFNDDGSMYPSLLPYYAIHAHLAHSTTPPRPQNTALSPPTYNQDSVAAELSLQPLVGPHCRQQALREGVLRGQGVVH